MFLPRPFWVVATHLRDLIRTATPLFALLFPTIVSTIKHHLTVRDDMLKRMIASGKAFTRGPGDWQMFSSVTSWADGYVRYFAATVREGQVFAYASTPHCHLRKS